jgi:hypothetical protein
MPNRKTTKAERKLAHQHQLKTAEALVSQYEATKRRRAMLKRIIDENPKASRSVLRAKYIREAKKDPAMVEASMKEVFSDLLKELAEDGVVDVKSKQEKLH